MPSRGDGTEAWVADVGASGVDSSGGSTAAAVLERWNAGALEQWKATEKERTGIWEVSATSAAGGGNAIAGGWHIGVGGGGGRGGGGCIRRVDGGGGVGAVECGGSGAVEGDGK